jgi:hypothetical protein
MKCQRCRSPYRGHGDWNVHMRAGEPQYLLCPTCQTPEENAEAAINEATLQYSVDEHGRGRAVPRVRRSA